MPLTTNANYDIYAALLNKKPCWIIEFDGISDKYTSNTFSGITGSYKKYIKDIDIQFSGIDWRANIQNPAHGTFKLLDKNLEITALIRDNNLFGKKVTIKHGFTDLVIGDFVSIYPQLYVDDIRLSDDHLHYEFTFSDTLLSLNVDLFYGIPSTNLNGALTDVATTVTVDFTEGFLATTFSKFSSLVYIKIDDEIMKYTATTSTTFTVVRGQLGTSAVAHSSRAAVKQIYLFSKGTSENFGLISDLILYPLLTSDAGTNGIYDAGIVRWGAGISESKIDVVEIRRTCFELWATQSATHNLYTNGLTYITLLNKWMIIDRKENCLSFLNRILAVINCVLYVNQNGKLSVKRADYWTYITATNSIAEKSASLVGGVKYDKKSLMNNIILNFPDNETTLTGFGLFVAKKYILLYGNSITAYGQTEAKEINWPCYHSLAGTITAAPPLFDNSQEACDFIGMFEEFLYLHGDVMSLGRLEANFTNMKYIAGDMVQWTNDFVPDAEAGTRGIVAEPILLLDKMIDFDKMYFNFMSFRLLNNVATVAAFGSYNTPNVQTMTFSADKDETLEAGDAYYDPVSAVTARWWKIKFELTPPASGSAKLAWVKINLKFFKVKTSTLVGGAGDENREYDEIMLQYDPSLSSVLTYEMYVVIPSAIYHTVERVKADWYDASESSGSGLRPSLLQMTGVANLSILQLVTAKQAAED